MSVSTKKEWLKPGSRCVVTDLRRGKQYQGVVEGIRVASGKVLVRYDDGTLVSVGRSFVSEAKA